MATPDHWHAYGACKAMESGKHVYLEKPCSHNMNESDLLVDYQKYFKKVVQMGNQQRSSPHTIELMQKIKDGEIGKTYKATAFYHSNRPRVPNQVLAPVPDGSRLGSYFRVLLLEENILLILGIIIGDGMVGIMVQARLVIMPLMS